MATASQCISPNPDIAGIGVRVAIYVQAILSLIVPFVAGFDGQIESFEMESASSAYIGILLPGCALVLSTVVQAKTFGLSVYHGLIVLNLSLINNMSSLTYFMLEAGDLLHGPRMQLRIWENFDERQANLAERWRKLGDVSEVEELDREMTVILAEAKEAEVEALKLSESIGPWLQKKRLLAEIEKWNWWIRQREFEGMLLGMGLDERQKARVGFEVLARASKTRTGLEATEPGTQDDEKTPSVQELEADIRASQRESLRFHIPKSTIFMVLCCSLHLIFASSFGLWLWYDIRTFGSEPACTPSTILIVFGKAVPVTSKALRIISIVLYTLSAIPFFNITVWGTFLSWTGNAVAWLTSARILSSGGDFNEARLKTSGRIFFTSSVITTTAAQLYLIITTESTIKKNQHLLKASEDGGANESDWTFGQTLALTLTIMPTIEVIKFLIKKARGVRY